ncbi:ABC transporter permease [Kocuria sp. HSID16901]|uniref:ABC transporter permease n=1 Tax=Kocuria sp. HSID16901 TaxID=2419505 RepID=UPI000ADF69AE|nr:ABC transporter permease [Kocuria sp. HSID16901]MCT1368123.1 ABC transporter permease [Rothia sp. p3-SID1597]
MTHPSDPQAPERTTSAPPREAIAPRTALRRRASANNPWLTGAVGVMIAVLLWWIFTHAAGAHNTLLAALEPERMPGAFASLFGRGVILPDIGVSLLRLVLGLGLGIVLGVPLGIAVGSLPRFAGASSPVIQFLRMVSPLSWAPIAVALFGVGHAPVIFLVGIAAIWPVVINTAAGVRAVDQHHVDVARVLGATGFEVLRHVVLPSARAHMLTGIRTALGIAWVIIVPAEMLGVTSGLGYEILNARDRLAYDEMLAVILVIGLLGIVLDALAQRLLRERKTRG